MEAVGEFGGQQAVDETVTLDPAETGKPPGDDSHPIMRAPARTGARVTGVPAGFGPLLSFEVAGSADAADAVIATARLIVPATSFGGVDSSWERRGRWAGETAPASLIRLSVGLEPPADLIADIDRALECVPLAR